MDKATEKAQAQAKEALEQKLQELQAEAEAQATSKSSSGAASYTGIDKDLKTFITGVTGVFSNLKPKSEGGSKTGYFLNHPTTGQHISKVEKTSKGLFKGYLTGHISNSRDTVAAKELQLLRDNNKL